jgi:hypothetical protein
MLCALQLPNSPPLLTVAQYHAGRSNHSSCSAGFPRPALVTPITPFNADDAYPHGFTGIQLVGRVVRCQFPALSGP